MFRIGSILANAEYINRKIRPNKEMKINGIKVIPHYDRNYNVSGITILPPKGFRVKGNVPTTIEFEPIDPK